jgi:predicted transposase YbfD/YdcC
MVLLATMRAHRAIETGLQWQPDLTLREDAARHRKDNSPGTIAFRRRRAPEVMRRIRRKAPMP